MLNSELDEYSLEISMSFEGTLSDSPVSLKGARELQCAIH